MEIVIKIEDYDREWIANGYYIPDEINEKIAEAIIDGTPLPKGHDRLIEDSEVLFQSIRDYCGPSKAYEILKEAKTIADADRERGGAEE